MSQVGGESQQLPDTGVRNRSMHADVIHRQDPAADEARPACPEADRPGARFTSGPLAAFLPTFDLCGNPECFGGEWR